MRRIFTNKRIIVFLFLLIIVANSYPSFRNLYFKHTIFRQELKEKLLASRTVYPTDEQFTKISDCLYSYLIKKYHSPNRFPGFSNYNQEDRNECLNCIRNYLNSDMQSGQNRISKMDSIRTNLWKY